MSRRRPGIWGVVNITPDSFSDGGEFFDSRSAVTHAVQMMSEGASVIDVGGESTRPGATRVAALEEQSRILPVITQLATEGIVVSVDTMRADTARKAVEAGAAIINDVSGGMADPKMFGVMAEVGCDVVLMHWRGHSLDMDSRASYGNLVTEVRSELNDRVEAAVGAGIAPERIILDPGLGFAKDVAQNWELTANLKNAVPPGFRVLVGASRKRFVGSVLAKDHAVTDRDGPSAQLGALLADQGVWALRVHNVVRQSEALALWQAFHQGGSDD